MATRITGINIANNSITIDDIDLTSLSTDNISEGANNQYFTTDRARQSISVAGDLSYDSNTGVISTQGLASSTTDDLAEGNTNLYYTTARANTDIDTRVTQSFVNALNIDADTLDGANGTYYLDFTNFTNLPDPTIDVTLTGDITGSGNTTLTNLTNGSISLITELSDTGVIANTYGSASLVPVITVDVDGRITNASAVSVAGVSNVSYDSANGVVIIDTADGGSYSAVITLDAFTTDNLTEGNTNLYYTTARANTDIDNRVTKTFIDNLGIDADTLDGANGSYYLDWTNITNKPDPNIEIVLSGDVTGSANVTLTDLTSVQIEITAAVTDDSHNHIISNIDGLQTDLDAKVDLAGDTMTGFLTLHSNPTQNLHAATKGYVDEVATGLQVKGSVEAATNNDIGATYDNGNNGIGSTLTIANTETLDIDGWTSWSQFDGILVKDQTNAYENGRYFVSTVGNTSIDWVLTRCGACDESDEIIGAFVFVAHGNTYESTGWVATVANVDSFAVGTDDITWTQFSGPGTYLAGTDLTLTGTTFSLNATISANTTGTANNATNLNGQAASYYLDWTNVTNKPDPVITLAGDLTGSVTLTDLASGTLTATVADNSHNHTVSNITDFTSSANTAIDNRVTKTFIDNLNVDADTLDSIDSGSFLRSDADDTSSGTIAFGAGGLDPDNYAAYSGGFGNISDGSGWGARGVFVHGGGTGDAAAMAHNGSGLYFGIQNGSSTNSMSTWLDVTPSRVISFGGTGLTYNTHTIWHAGNDGSGSGLDADTLDSYHRLELVPYQSSSDFADGTLVTTNINSSASEGDSFVIEITGKAYGSSVPHSVIAEGYLYNNTIINTNGVNITGSNFTYLKVMNNSGYLSVWWPRHGYWNSYSVIVRSSSGGTSSQNRVTSIANSTDPAAATKKIQIDLAKSWTSSNDGSGSTLDADLLDGQHGSYYAPINNPTFTGTVTAPDFNSTSDMRVKDNIEVIENAINKVKQIRGVTFTRKDQEDKTKRYTGIIAQEVEKVLPEAIGGNEEHKTVAYGNMVGLLIEAIKEQQKTINTLIARIELLESK